MPLVVADRVRETTTTTGTGTITLAGAVPGYQSFSVIGNANTTYYTINVDNQWEVGIGTYLGAGPTLSRDTVLESSNAGALVDFAAGAKDVFLTYPAERSVYQDGSAIAAGSAVLPIANGGTNATTAGAALTSLGAYPAANPSGFTSNTGTVTSVGGTGTVSGLTLTGSITTSGSLTLGGTLALTSGDVTTALGFTPYNATNPSGYLSTVNLATNVTGTLPVANGGTGVTASTGTTAVVLSNSPTLVTPTLGAASATSIAAALGSVSAPSYTFTGDTNTGIFSPAADTLAFVEGGVEALRLLSTGGITSPDLVDAVGYKGLPQNSRAASYTLALSDMGKMINTTTGGVVIPANGSVAFPIGSTVIIYNNSASNQTISITTDTIYLAGTATTGSRTLAQRGLATCVKVASTTWVVSGAGVT